MRRRKIRILPSRRPRRDMESTKIMDRLICGDVGYGKTEIAIRAAFKAVQDGKQVAFLVPTTILAQQHYNNFVAADERFSGDMWICSAGSVQQAEQKKTLEEAEKGAGGYYHRHAPAAVKRCAVQGSGTSDHRRGAAFRCDAQGENQAAEEQHRCAHPDGNADSADAAHEPDRNPGYERAGGTADGPCARSRPM